MSAVEDALLSALGLQPTQDQPADDGTLQVQGTGALDNVPRFGFRPPALQPTQQGSGGSFGGGGGGGGGSGWADQIARQFGLRVTSGYRDPQHNAAVGGVKGSYHTQMDRYGQSRAYDFVGSPQAEAAALAYARSLGAVEAMIHSVPGGGGVHLHIAR